MHDQHKYLQKCLQILQQINPSLAHQLTLAHPSELEFCMTEENELNLRRCYERNTYYYHSPISALKEARNWFHSLHTASTLFVYGIGLGYAYAAAKEWLEKDPHHALVFLEEDLNVLFRLCETELGWRLLKDPQVQLFSLRDHDSNKVLFNELTWTYFDTSYIISSLPLYREMNPKGFLEIENEIQFQFEQKKVVVGEYLNFGIVFFRNFYPNLFELPKAYWGNGLFNSFSKIPAIICGAGPSLNKNIDLLSQLKERALIFAGGSALSALIPKKIIPHFGVAIDPNLHQHSRIAATQEYKIPFFYHNRLFHKALTAITGPLLFLNGEGGYHIPDWFEKQLNIEGEKLDGGHNVVNFSLQIARALGCNPIIIVGTDLAFTNNEYYADGIATHLNLTNEEVNIHNPEVPVILREDIHGQPIHTLWKWISESEWISDFAALNPELTVINCTEGGLGFKGIPNHSLKEIVDQFLQEPRAEINHVHEEIQKHSLNHINKEKIVNLLNEMQESLTHCTLLLSKMLEEIDLLKQAMEQNYAAIPPDLQTLQMALIQSDLEDHFTYPYLLEVFNQIFIRLHHRAFQDLQSPKKDLPEQKRALGKLELDKERFIFLRDVARVNREIIQHVIHEKTKVT